MVLVRYIKNGILFRECIWRAIKTVETQTISLTDILAKELERGFDLTNDNAVGDRIVDLTKQLPLLKEERLR